MPELDFIVKTPKLEKSQDYAFLRSEGLKHVEKLAHRLWTDYNVHDPGVTIMELLCYAITDLGYRTGYDIKDLLTETDRGVAVNPANFHTALEVLTCNPVSFDDLRKLLIDIRGARNAWIEPHCSVEYCLDTVDKKLLDCGPSEEHIVTNPSMNGLYDVFIEYEDFIQTAPRSMRVGLPDNIKGSGGFVESQAQGIRFHVAYPLTLQAVSVYPEAAGELTVRLLRTGETDPIKSVTVNVHNAGEKNRVSLAFNIPAGEDYRLDAKGTPIKLYHRSDPSFPYALENVIYLVSGVQGTQPEQPYFFFYDWEISYAASPAAVFSPPPITASVGLMDASGSGGYIDPLDSGIDFQVMRDMVLETVDVYTEAAEHVTIRLLDAAGLELESVEAPVDSAQEATPIALGFELKGGLKYRLDALGTTVKLHRTTGADYPYSTKNVITLTAGHPSSDAVYFFYNWTVSYPSQPQPSAVTREDVQIAARERLHTHRNLCEDFVNVCDLETEEVAVCADIEVSPSADVEEVLAEIFYRLGLHVSPSVSFYTIEELLDRGKTTDQIFEGPQLDHGFIDDDEFQAIQRRCEVRTSDIVRLLMDVEGVVAVKNISLLSFLEGELRTQEKWVLELAADKFRAPEFTPDRSKIIFYKNSLPYYANRDQVKELLREKKAADLESKLTGHDRDLPVPVGEFKNPSEYQPLQNELPMNYRVGQIRVPASEGALRKAQSRQLKAYLMFFEQLLANYLAQLAHVGELFSWEDNGISTYFTQKIQGIAELEDIYNQDFIASEYGTVDGALTAIVEDEKTPVERKSRFLEHLVGRFAESFTDYSLLMYSMQQEASLTRVIDDKRAFLDDYPRVSAERGTAYDYRYPERADNLSGYQQRVYRLLGIQEVTRRNLAGHCFEIQSMSVPQDGDSVTRWCFVLKDSGGVHLFESILCESRSAIEGLLDFALGVGGDPDNYRMKGWDLRLMSVSATDELVDEGRSLVVVALVGTELHIRIFDAGGEKVVDKAERELVAGETLTALKQRLSPFPDESGLSWQDKQEIIADATSIAGHARMKDDGSAHELLRRCADEAKDEPIGATTSPDASVLSEVQSYFGQIGGAEGFHVVEHVLLRKRTTDDPFLPVQMNEAGECECIEVREPYSFRISVVLPSWPERFRDLRFRRFIEDLLRSEAPAHIFLKICWTSHAQMKELEECYGEWSARLAELGESLGGCRTGETSLEDAFLSGELPLPATTTQGHQAYAEALGDLIEKLHRLVAVYPLARLHDCTETQGDTPQITLNNTSLGTF